MSDALFSRRLRSISARPRRGWELLLSAADIPGQLAILALAAVILIASVVAIGSCFLS
jgi:hypothetical protein